MTYPHRLILAIAALAALAPMIAFAQTYKFDGHADMDPQPADTTDWFISTNWGEPFGGSLLDPLNNMIPDLGIRVEVQTSTLGVNAPEIRTGAAQAQQVRIGRTGGDGLLTMTGGTLTLNSSTSNNRFRVGSDDPEDPSTPLAMRHEGTFNMSAGTLAAPSFWVGSGSTGTVNLSGGTINVGENLYMDWSYDAFSVLNMTGGNINVTGVLRMFKNSTLNIGGGQLHVNGTVELGTTDENQPQTPNAQVTMTNGVLDGGGFLKVNGAVVLNGGTLRAANFQEGLSTGHIELNAGGTLQFKNAQESISSVQTLVTGGFITTTSPQGTSAFQYSVVNISGTDYTQVTLPAAGANGDFNLDGHIDGADFLVWQRQFNSTRTATDLVNWRNNYGSQSVPAATAAPEPTSAFIALAAGIMIAANVRRRR